MRRNENDPRVILRRENDLLRQVNMKVKVNENVNVNEIENSKASKVEGVCAYFEGTVAPCS